jgi:hypothetical protein
MQRTHRLTESLLSAGGLCVLVAGTAAISSEAREHLLNVVSGDRASELATIAAPAHRAALVVAATLRDVHAAPGSVLAFGLGAVVLFILMIRS